MNFEGARKLQDVLDNKLGKSAVSILGAPGAEGENRTYFSLKPSGFFKDNGGVIFKELSPADILEALETGGLMASADNSDQPVDPDMPQIEFLSVYTGISHIVGSPHDPQVLVRDINC